MKSNKLCSVVKWLIANSSRLILALVLIFSGIVKLIDPHGTEYKIEDYALSFGVSEFLPIYAPLVLAIALAMFEFCMGVNLLFVINRRLTSTLVLIFLTIFTPFTLYLAIENPVHDCGCFGDAWKLTNWQTFIKNVILLTSAIIMTMYHKLQSRLISIHSQWLVSTYTWVFGFVLVSYSIYTLPPIDFRPYYIGADLNKQMQWDDSGNVPPISDLIITDPVTGDDLTDSLINLPGWKFWVIIPRIENADDGVMDKLTELTDYCNNNGYQILALTASNDEMINNWRDFTGAEYDFKVVDEIPLKTMVRSNPGLILLSGSRVVNKWASSQIPNASELDKPLEEISWTSNTDSTLAERAGMLLSWYLIPLLLCTIIDRAWMGIKMYREKRNRI